VSKDLSCCCDIHNSLHMAFSVDGFIFTASTGGDTFAQPARGVPVPSAWTFGLASLATVGFEAEYQSIIARTLSSQRQAFGLAMRTPPIMYLSVVSL
jgi:hypothetical protein